MVVSCSDSLLSRRVLARDNLIIPGAQTVAMYIARGSAIVGFSDYIVNPPGDKFETSPEIRAGGPN